MSNSIQIQASAEPAGNPGEIQWNDNGDFGASSSLFWDNANERLGVGTNLPEFKLNLLEIDNPINIVGTSDTINVSSEGKLLIGHGYSPTVFGGIPNNITSKIEFTGEATPAGFFGDDIVFSTTDILAAPFPGDASSERMRIKAGGNVGIGTDSPQSRLDVRAQGALSTDIAFRVRNSADTHNFLLVNGAGDVFNNGQQGVNSNTFFGENTGRNTTGVNNSFFGSLAGRDVSSGADNVFFGQQSGRNTTSGLANTFIGKSAGQSNTTGAQNTYIGRNAGLFISNGSLNVFIGNDSGRFLAAGTSMTNASQSVFIGFDSRAQANGQTNQIVIGHQAIGSGSNTVTLGNTSIIKTILRGTINAAGLPTSSVGLVAGDIWNDSGTLKIV
jgi:hypothetical protein